MNKKVSKDEALKAVKTITKEISESSLEQEALDAVRTLILWAGDDPEREGLIDTPKRVVKAYTEFFSGYEEDPKKAIKSYVIASEEANKIGLGINAGHDLNLENIEFFAKNIPNLLEVSIGHAIICESIYLGLENVIPMYLNLIK